MLVVAEPLLEQALGEGWTRPARRFTGARDGALDLPAARSTWSTIPGRALRRPRRLRHDRGRHRAGAPGPRLRRGRPRGLPRATACRWSTRSRPDGTFERRRAAGRRACSSRRPTSASSPTCSARGLLFRHVPYEHSYPHCWRCHTRAPLLRAAVLVHPHHRRSRTRCCGENERTNWYPGRRSSTAATATGCTTTSTGRCRATATGALRCRSGAATERPPHLRRLAGRAAAAGRPRPVRPRPAPARTSTTSPSPAPSAARQAPPGARGHRRLVRLRLDAVRPVGLPARARAARSSSSGATRRSSSARRSTRPAAGSTR